MLPNMRMCSNSIVPQDSNIFTLTAVNVKLGKVRHPEHGEGSPKIQEILRHAQDDIFALKGERTDRLRKEGMVLKLALFAEQIFFQSSSTSNSSELKTLSSSIARSVINSCSRFLKFHML